MSIIHMNKILIYIITYNILNKLNIDNYTKLMSN